MKIEVDDNRDVLTLNLLSDVSIAESKEVEGLIVRYAADRRIVGIEIRGARQRIDQKIAHLIPPALSPSAA